MIDLFTLVDPLKHEVQPPGVDLSPDATDDDFLLFLTNVFWELRLYGLLGGFEENAAARGGPDRFVDGIVTPFNVDDVYDEPNGYAPSDLGRDAQQLIILFAGYKVMLTRLSNAQAVFRARAGSVEIETHTAATMIRAVLDQLKERIDYILNNLTNASRTTVDVFDSILERSYSLASGELRWVR